MYPDVKVISRPGEVNAWDNPDFRAAVKATGKSQLVIGGIAADVCTTFLALSLRAEGYAVFANADASATYSLRAAQDANDRMRAHGVEILSWFAVISELFRDWRNPSPNVTTVINEMNKYFPIGGWVGRQHAAAILDGKLLPGEGSLVGQ
ncbi:MAG: hypothetical protein M1831_004466 [Alyxoria varia]|nr:MAG: hypothetical protein M1831_004466 [Alyxoria varia]